MLFIKDEQGNLVNMAHVTMLQVVPNILCGTNDGLTYEGFGLVAYEGRVKHTLWKSGLKEDVDRTMEDICGWLKDSLFDVNVWYPIPGDSLVSGDRRPRRKRT